MERNKHFRSCRRTRMVQVRGAIVEPVLIRLARPKSISALYPLDTPNWRRAYSFRHSTWPEMTFWVHHIATELISFLGIQSALQHSRSTFDMPWTQLHKICWPCAGKEEHLECTSRRFHGAGLACLLWRKQVWLSTEIIQVYIILCVKTAALLPRSVPTQ